MKILVFLGSIRQSQPPKPARLGARVARAMAAHLSSGNSDDVIEIIDPLEYDLGEVFKPYFAYAPKNAPQALATLADKIRQADGYVMVSPEYNHSMSPALAHLLNHFGSSLYGFKPSLIVTYSAGQWGGARAAVGMRTFLGELGCLAVSAMIHLPKAQDVFEEDGSYADGVDGSRWESYFARGSAQLRWWAEAAKAQRSAVNPDDAIGHFTKTPEQRNAPGS
ncbi:NADPH-dependent FMN reductase [Pokkaliibacter sp. CJK22405]|uniref:NADPH-dependent FMN reductase n=1 Tax=Pokkaliibacter sp. CJK22405 TaxID=3384615 RepID=UPI003984678B